MGFACAPSSIRAACFAAILAIAFGGCEGIASRGPEAGNERGDGQMSPAPDGGCRTDSACDAGDHGVDAAVDGGAGMDASPDSGETSDAGDAGILDAGQDAGPPSVGGIAPFNVNPDTVTVSGISAGAFMAVQLLVAYSASIHGATVVAGGPYDCYQGNYDDLTLAECATGLGIGNDVSAFVSYTNTQASMGTIDPVSNIAGKPIYMFSGTEDLVINQAVMNALQQYLESFTDGSNIDYDSSTPAEHAWISPDATNACDLLASPYLNNCGFDMEQDFLTLFYGPVSSRSTTPQGSYIQFDQDAFCPGADCQGISMDSTGWLYVPASCAAGQSCRLVVVLHGCLSDQQDIGRALVDESGVNEWADGNGILVLYPQAVATSSSPDDCWDFTGYTGSNYLLKSAPQMTAIMAMVRQITSGAQ